MLRCARRMPAADSSSPPDVLQTSHDKLRPILERRDYGFRWRGKEVSRIEGLSDAVFAFAITLLVASLQAPRRFEELQRLMHGFVSFGICFGLLVMIWHAQYIYFRRYALDDMRTFLLNAFLLFVVAFYVYPLKFLFTVFVNGITGYREVDDSGRLINAMASGDWRPLMIIYSAGFMAVYIVFALLYQHAYKLRGELELNELEIYETRSVVQENILMVAIGAVAIILAMLNGPAFSGMTYILIGPLQTALGFKHSKRRKEIAATMQA